MDVPVMQLGDPGGVPVTLPDAELVAQIPEGVAVKLVVDCATGLHRYEALLPEEIKLREADQAAAAAQAELDAKAQADRDALIASLAAGTATDVEVQQALAQVLGS